ncbi:MAG: response regulator transcription factor [Lysobacterales bacterium]
MRILLVEDEATLAEPVMELLRDETYSVDWARTGMDASRLMHDNEGSYDLVILDWTIPSPSGLELLGDWRKHGIETPVLMLTGRVAIADRVGGLDTGADDYLTKPFVFDELLARVRSLLRRRATPIKTLLATGDLTMDRTAHVVTVDDQRVELSPKEFAVLEYFLHHVDELVTRADLTEHVWDESFDPQSNVIDVTVHRLRRKIDGARGKRLVHTLKGVGYILKGRRE